MYFYLLPDKMAVLKQMRRINAISVFVIGFLLASCKADMICPSYQSYFILDEGTQKSQFTYFALDSLPRRDIFNSSKDKNGLVAKTSLLAYVDADWVRNREIKTIDMEVVYPQISDSTLFAGDAMMFAETDVVDTLALDSARMAAQTFKYGADQKYYNWYFRDKLVWKDELEKEEATSNDENVEKKGIFGFLKGLFNKKDSTEQVQETDTEGEPQQKESWLKGLFNKKEKTPKEPKQKKEKAKKQKADEPIFEEANPPAKQEEEDDGEDDF